jgi:hypothetical protein
MSDTIYQVVSDPPRGGSFELSVGVSLGMSRFPRNKMKILISALVKQPAEPLAN